MLGTYVPTNVAAWSCIHGIPVSDGEHALEGVAKDRRCKCSHLAESEQSSRKPCQLDIFRLFQRELARSDPAKQSSKLDIWKKFQSELARIGTAKQSVQLDIWATFRPGLAGPGSDPAKQSSELDIWKRLLYNHSLHGVMLPSSLQSLTFGNDHNHSLHGVMLPSSLQSLTYGKCFNQSLQGVTLPSSLQRWACCGCEVCIKG